MNAPSPLRRLTSETASSSTASSREEGDDGDSAESSSASSSSLSPLLQHPQAPSDPHKKKHWTAASATAATTTTTITRRRQWYLIVSVVLAAGVSLYQVRIAVNLSHRGGGGRREREEPSGWASTTPRKNNKARTTPARSGRSDGGGSSSADSPIASGASNRTHSAAVPALLLRLDEAAPPARDAVTHFLRSSIPAEMRLPHHRAGNDALLYSDPLLQKRRYVFEFNPSVVVLPESQRGVAPNATYLACYRVSTQHACYHQERNDIRHKNYIGFAVLDANLNMLLETTINPANPLRRFEDFRLFVLRDELYVASFQSLHRFWIHNPPTSDEEEGGGRRRNGGTVVAPTLTPNLRSNLTITIERFRRCSRDPEISRTAKSLTYFAMPNGSIVMEPYPMVDKEVIPDVLCNSDTTNGSIGKASIPLAKAKLPAPSFRTTDEAYLTKTPGMRLPALTSDRGSYCCATIEHEGVPYLLGVSHLKTRYFNGPAPKNPVANQYFTRFYAMHSEPPYEVVAQSGRFCFGAHWDHMNFHRPLRNDQADRTYVPDPYLNLTSARRLALGNESYACPGIHFVSGMTDDATDPANRLVIGYGVNDCFARMVVVEKAHVAQMLFGRQ
jgi:hypothetical protein